jgi:hypothetical protein
VIATRIVIPAKQVLVKTENGDPEKDPSTDFDAAGCPVAAGHDFDILHDIISLSKRARLIR